MTTTNNFYIIDEYSKHDVTITEYNAEDYTGWYRVIYDDDGSIKTVIEITQRYLNEVSLSEKGETWTLTKWFRTVKDNDATPDIDESKTGGISVSKEKYFVDWKSIKQITQNEYSDYIGWYRIIRDNKENITDVIEITEDYVVSIYFNDPVWEITRSYTINPDYSPEEFIYNTSKKNKINTDKLVTSVTSGETTEAELTATEKLKARAIKYAPKINLVEFPDTLVTSDCNEFANPYRDKSPGVAKKYDVDIIAKRVKK